MRIRMHRFNLHRTRCLDRAEQSARLTRMIVDHANTPDHFAMIKRSASDLPDAYDLPGPGAKLWV